MTPDSVSVAARALAFVALFQAAGAAFFILIFRKHLTLSRLPIQRLGFVAASVGLILVLGHETVEAARMAGDFTGLWDRDLQRLAWASPAGVSQIVQVIGLLMVIVAIGRRTGFGAAWASVGGVIVIAAFLLTGHTSVHRLRIILAPLLALHLLIVAFWFGALVPLALVSRIEGPLIASAVLTRFSSIATTLVPVIAVAGIAMAWILTGYLGALRKPYGELLLAKLAGFILLMLLAAYNKWRLTPAMSTGEVGAVSSLRRSIGAEYVLIVAVLSVTAALTTFYSPD